MAEQVARAETHDEAKAIRASWDAATYAKAKQAADDAYVAGAPIMSDERYDAVFRNASTESEQVAGNPVAMGSLDKVKAGEEPSAAIIAKFASRVAAPYAVSEKLDGCSAMYVGGRLYSRWGVDISHVDRDFLHLPALPAHVAVRGELVIPDRSFGELRSSHGYTKSRSAVAGAISPDNSSDSRGDILGRVHFVVYEHIDTRDLVQSMSFVQGLVAAKAAGFRTVGFEIVEAKELDEDVLVVALQKARSRTSYPIDGVVVCSSDAPADRGDVYSSGNPRYAIAFKKNASGLETTIRNIRWVTGKTGRVIPTLEFDAVHIDGSVVGSATGHNAKNVVARGLGAGARITVFLSGEIIPKIDRVVAPAPPTLPADAVWDTSETHLVSNDAMKLHVPKMHYFLTTLKIKRVGANFLRLAFAANILCRVQDLVFLMEPSSSAAAKTAKLLSKVKGIGPTRIQSLLQQLANISPDAATFVCATGMSGTGIGKRKLAKLFQHLGFENVVKNGSSCIRGVEAWQDKSVRVFAEAWPEFQALWNDDRFPARIRTALTKEPDEAKEAGAETKEAEADEAKEAGAEWPPELQKVLLTGARHGDIQRMLGDRLASGWSSKITMVVVPDMSVSNSKTRKAKQAGVPVVTHDTFLKTYLA